MIALFSIAGALPVQTENLHSSPSICSVMPISAVCKYKMKKNIYTIKKMANLELSVIMYFCTYFSEKVRNLF